MVKGRDWAHTWPSLNEFLDLKLFLSFPIHKNEAHSAPPPNVGMECQRVDGGKDHVQTRHVNSNPDYEVHCALISDIYHLS